PPLTTLRQPRAQIGAELAALLDETIRNRRTAPRRITLEAHLMVRRSTGPPPG
ncbi:MAG TPA: substrate-binding domain-containing protein, partial [Roseiflexaceae bacterium]|nr:substrate-binding domain-containing protein [Roseiflexaceae bacterium]